MKSSLPNEKSNLLEQGGVLNTVPYDYNSDRASTAASSTAAAGGRLNDDRKGRKVVVLGILVLAILIGICVAVIFTSQPDQTLQGAVTVDNIFAHLSNFDTIARTGGLNSRSVATNYNLSGLYVMDQLSSHGVCEPQMQVFAFPIHKYNATPKLQQLGPLSIDYISGDDFIGMNYGGNGTYADETAPFFYVNTGCEAADYEGIPVGSIVGADYVGCDIYFKAKAAQNSSMTAILIMNPEGETTLPRFLVNVLSWQVGEEPPIDTLIQMPVFAVSYSVGATLKALAPTSGFILDRPQLSFSFDATLTIESTYNIICDTDPSATENVIVVGAHLDSVPQGPGLDDNASGSATVLELAIQFSNLGFKSTAVNAVRFAWWAAEEVGLVGSGYYVHQLILAGKQGEVAVYLNYDMLGAPNYVPQIHNPLQANDVVPENVRLASVHVQDLYIQFFNESGLPFTTTGMYGGSDYLPFIESGIPSGGMATGASNHKSADQREVFGGFAGAAFDPCYHQACDTLANISPEAIRQCSGAAAFVLQTLAFESSLQDFIGLNPSTAEDEL